MDEHNPEDDQPYEKSIYESGCLSFLTRKGTVNGFPVDVLLLRIGQVAMWVNYQAPLDVRTCICNSAHHRRIVMVERDGRIDTFEGTLNFSYGDEDEAIFSLPTYTYQGSGFNLTLLEEPPDEPARTV